MSDPMDQEEVFNQLSAVVRLNLAKMLRVWAMAAEKSDQWDTIDGDELKIRNANLGNGVRLKCVSAPTFIRLSAHIDRVPTDGNENPTTGLPAGTLEGTPEQSQTEEIKADQKPPADVLGHESTL